MENIGVATDKDGWVIVDKKMQTSTADVYAIGDLPGPARVMLAHVASTEGEIAVENCFDADKIMLYDHIPGAIFTSPGIGNIGFSEMEASPAITMGASVKDLAKNYSCHPTPAEVLLETSFKALDAPLHS